VGQKKPKKLKVFIWKGRENKGRVRSGEMEAASLGNVRSRLERLKITPIRVKRKYRHDPSKALKVKRLPMPWIFRVDLPYIENGVIFLILLLFCAFVLLYKLFMSMIDFLFWFFSQLVEYIRTALLL
jgi:hypothetical protein